MATLKHIGLLFSFSVFSFSAWAGSVTIPNTFSAGTPAVAAQVNANFTAVKTAVDDNNSRIAQLEAENAQLTSRIVALEAFMAEVQSAMSIGTDAQGYPAVEFIGVNVHIVNGVGVTASNNGTGNLIVGYNEVTTLTTEVCSKGEYASQPDCEGGNGVWQASHKKGSHNVIIGPEHNYSQYGSLLAGQQNTVNRGSATVSGGAKNIARGFISNISGGSLNITSGRQSSIAGGQQNTATMQDSAVSGGYSNTAAAFASTVGGGSSRSATDGYDWVAGTLIQNQ